VRCSRLLGVLFLLAACSRTTEFIGTVPGAIWNCGARCFRDENPPPEFAVMPDPITANRPVLLYPLPGSVQPIDVADLTFHWRSARGVLSYYRVRVAPARDPAHPYDFYVPCRPPPSDPTPPAPDECTYPLPAAAWAQVAGENRDAEVIVTVEAADLSRKVVASSEPARLSFAPAAIEAGLYYFSQGRSGIVRRLVGTPEQPFVLPVTATNRFGCASCHSVSRDGGTLAFTAESRPGYLTAARTEDPGQPLIVPPVPPQTDAAWLAVNPDGTLVLVGAPDAAVLREIATGRELARLGPAELAGGKLYFPEWSPDGTAVVATLATREENPYTVDDGSIVVLPRQGGTLGPPRVVVAGDSAFFHVYPTFSPDGAWIAFTSVPAGGRSYDNPQARLRLVPRAGDRAPIELARAAQQRGASWPRFAPVAHAGGNVLYLTFDGKLDYGYFLRNGLDPAGGRSQVWLTTIDLRRVAGGDPSSAPVWLPYQDTHVANVLGVWAERLACGPQSPCGDGARCDSGRCVRAAP
jgi:hypothetical protein